MIVIADASPINYLVLIGAAEVLQPLYRHVIVPFTVAEELKHPHSPAAVLSWIAKPPAWFEVRADPPSDPMLGFLDPGERAAQTLAQLLNAGELLMDEQAGRAEAERRHLRVTGTLGVLADAHQAGLVDFDLALEPLRSTNFRLDLYVEWLVRRRLSGVKKES